MKVAKWYNNQDIRIEEVPTPRPGHNEMLVKVMSCGICGSDIVEWYRLPRAPLVPGHEIGAQVMEVGESIKKYKPFDRVFIAPKVPCMKCDYCQKGHYSICSTIKERLPGGFAEYILVPQALIENGTYRLPDTITYDQSTFIEPLACVVGAQRLAGIQQGDTVLIIGCGMSGLLHVKLAKKKNCTVVAIDIHPKKLEYAKKFGADMTIDASTYAPERIYEKYGRKADIVILCASALSAVEQAWESIDKGGTVVFFAVPGPDKKVEIPINTFWTKEIKILTSYFCGPPDIAEAMKLIKEKEISVIDMITHKYDLHDVKKGLQLVADGRESLKVIISPNETILPEG